MSEVVCWKTCGAASEGANCHIGKVMYSISNKPAEMASAVYEGPGGLVCTAVVFPSVVALFRLLRAPLRPLMSDHLQRAGIHASQDQLDKGVACDPASYSVR